MFLNHKELEKDELRLPILSTPTLAGLCITIIAAFHRRSDDIFAFCYVRVLCLLRYKSNI